MLPLISLCHYSLARLTGGNGSVVIIGEVSQEETTDAHPFWVVTDNPDLERAARGTVDENGVILYHENIDPTLYHKAQYQKRQNNGF